MGQVALTLNGRTYRLACEDGDEPRLAALADYVSSKLDGLVRDVGKAGEAQLFLMTALLIADELFDATEPAQDAGLVALQQMAAANAADGTSRDGADAVVREKRAK